MKVYIITRGDYSAYEICAVTLDETRAKKLVRYYGDSIDEARIEEYDTDGGLSDEVLDHLVPLYCVQIKPDDHFDVYISRYVDGTTKYDPSFYFDPLNPYRKTPLKVPAFFAYLTAKDKEHALKIAIDKRAQMLAEKFRL